MTAFPPGRPVRRNASDPSGLDPAGWVGEAWLMTMNIAHLGLLDDEEIELDAAALELSALDHEGLDLAPYQALLISVADKLALVGGHLSSAEEQGEALAHVMRGEYGFVGDSQSYDAPLNADMIRVIDRRKGLPVSLSILYVAAARRMGWIAHALNTPFHVLVQIGIEDSSVVIDPFNGGEIVTLDRLVALIAQSGGGAGPISAHLEPMTNRMVLVRLLLNQASRAEQGGDVARAITIYERMVTVAPAHAQGWWELARLQLATRQVDAARASLSAMLEMTRDPTRRQHIIAALAAIAAGE